MRNLIIIFFCVIAAFFSRAQSVWLHPNVGQWDKEIIYSVDMASGHLYVDKQGFTYVLHDAMAHKHDGEEHESEDHDGKIHAQVVKSHFLNSSWQGQKTEASSSDFYRNYFIGNDESRWKSNVKSYAQTTLNDFYPGIDFLLDGTSNQLKYSFKVKPGIESSQIKWQVEGANRVYIEENQVHIETDLGEIVEDKPIAWTLKDGKKKFVDVEWAPRHNSVFLVNIQVEALDRARLLSDVTKTLSDQHVNILSASVTTTRDRVALSRFTFEMSDPRHLGTVLQSVRAIDGVYDCYRV